MTPERIAQMESPQPPTAATPFLAAGGPRRSLVTGRRTSTTTRNDHSLGVH